MTSETDLQALSRATAPTSRAEICAYINDRPILLSLLYDLDLLPEQHEENTPDDERMRCIVGHFRAGLSELEAANARAARMEEALKELVRQITKFAEEQGEADFYTGDAIKALADSSPNAWLLERLGAEKIIAFVDGVKWWEYKQSGATLWASDRNDAEAEAARKYSIRALPEGE